MDSWCWAPYSKQSRLWSWTKVCSWISFRWHFKVRTSDVALNSTWTRRISKEVTPRKAQDIYFQVHLPMIEPPPKEAIPQPLVTEPKAYVTVARKKGSLPRNWNLYGSVITFLQFSAFSFIAYTQRYSLKSSSLQTRNIEAGNIQVSGHWKPPWRHQSTFSIVF